MAMQWSKINRCIVCGEKLRFIPSAAKNARNGEGIRICEQNHKRFTVSGKYGEDGKWRLRYILPG